MIKRTEIGWSSRLEIVSLNRELMYHIFPDALIPATRVQRRVVIEHDEWTRLHYAIALLVLFLIWAIWTFLLWLWTILCAALPWLLAIACVFLVRWCVINCRKESAKAIERDRLIRLAFIEANDSLNADL